MKNLALFLWSVLILLAFCGPMFLLVLGIVFVVGFIAAFAKPEWFDNRKQ